MYDDIRLHVARSYTSSADSPFSLMSFFTLSNHAPRSPADSFAMAGPITHCLLRACLGPGREDMRGQWSVWWAHLLKKLCGAYIKKTSNIVKWSSRRPTVCVFLPHSMRSSFLLYLIKKTILECYYINDYRSVSNSYYVVLKNQWESRILGIHRKHHWLYIRTKHTR